MLNVRLSCDKCLHDNLEFIEDPFAEKANELMKNTEAMIGEQLIHLIRDRYE